MQKAKVEHLQRVYWLRAQRWVNNKIIFCSCERFEDYQVC